MKLKYILALFILYGQMLAAQTTLVSSGFSSGFTSATAGGFSLTAIAGATLAGAPQNGLSSGYGALLGSSSALFVGFNSSSVASTAAVNTAIPITISPRILGASGNAKIYFRSGGASAFSSITMTNNNNGTYSGQIPAIDSRGVDYYLEVTDSTSATAKDPSSAPAQWYSVGATFTSLNGLVVIPASSPGDPHFRMIAVPFILNQKNPAQVLSNFGGQSDQTWRLFRWLDDGNASVSNSEYQEITASNPSGDFTIGNAFWFIAAAADTVQTGGAGSANLTLPGDSVAITLGKEWNMIGCPYNFAVKWDDVRKPGTMALYDPSQNNAGVTNLNPWQGYWVRNETGANITIMIPAKETNTPGKVRAKALGQNEWSVNLQATSGDNQDWLKVGVQNSAMDKYDNNDLFKTPSIPGNTINMSIPHWDWDKAYVYAQDMRGVTSQGHVWDFEVNAGAKGDLVHVNLSDFASVPQDFAIMFFDKDLKISKNIREDNSYSFAGAKGKDIQRHFRIAVGTNEFVHQNDLGILAIPKEFDLSQNFPNPFNPTTTVKYSLPFRSQVEIKIYNVLGQEVKTLINEERPAGYHLAFWDSKNTANMQVSSGIYFYRIQARALDGSKNFVKSRKMLLIK